MTTVKPTLPTHKRQLSVKTSQTSPASPTIASFVTNLRLLNLDLLPDWPHITAHSLGPHDARSRIRGTEHALYQLFRLWDPAAAADKLQPFYPPLEPLQSVNLRAALFRALAEVKKAGILPRDAVLRKSMLDDCQGDRFWEVCLAFSAAVLRRHAYAKRRRSGEGPSVALRIATASALSRSDRASMLPLAIAHKAALRRVLDDKERRRETYARLHDVLIAKDAELRRRKANAQNRVAAPMDSERLMAVERAVERDWIGSVDLRDALIGGDVCADGDGVLLRSFDGVWNAKGLDGDALYTRSAAETGFLQGLRESVAEQSERRRHWQNLHEKLIASRPKSTLSSSRKSDPLDPPVRFDRHRDINLNNASPDPEARSPRKHERQDSVMRYDEILTAMREELRKNVSSRQGQSSTRTSPSGQPLRRAQSQSNPSRRTSILFDNSSGVQRHHQRSPSQTAVPMRPRLGSRASSRSRSYNQPKVAGQREPIPLKSEIFSPLKRGSAGSSLLASPAEDDETCTMSPSDRSTPGMSSSERATPAMPSRELGDGFAGVGLGIDANELSSATDPDVQPSIPGDGFDTPRAPPANPSQTAPDTTATIRPSLAERTRMSMAFNAGAATPSRKPITSGPSAPSPSGENRPPSSPLPDIRDVGGHNTNDSSSASDEAFTGSLTPQLTLAQRAQHSISLAPQRAPAANPIATALPLNGRKAFATPVRPRAVAPARPTPVPEDRREDCPSSSPPLGADAVSPPTSGRRVVTPLEQLMSPDTDYESVFKRRPRWAAVPPPSAGLGGEAERV